MAITALASGGVLLAPAPNVLQGPGSAANVVGPDGSAIFSSQPGGAVVSNGVTAYAVAPPPPAATLVAARAPLPLAPAVVAAPLAAPVAPVAVVAPGSGLEGQYVPDNSEQLYDDGSYKGEY